jgi:hypothetical protein
VVFRCKVLVRERLEFHRFAARGVSTHHLYAGLWYAKVTRQQFLNRCVGSSFVRQGAYPDTQKPRVPPDNFVARGAGLDLYSL